MLDRRLSWELLQKLSPVPLSEVIKEREMPICVCESQLKTAVDFEEKLSICTKSSS